MNALNSSNTYEIGAVLTGFKVSSDNRAVSMGIETELFNASSWILKVTANYGLVH